MEWRKIEGFENYSVSDTGLVRNDDKGNVLRPFDKHGYLIAELWKDKKRYRFFVHRLVATAFIDNPKDLPVVNHIDGNKRNNHVSNLEWCTAEYNNDHAIQTGLTKTVPVMVGDCRCNTITMAARICGVSTATIQGALDGRRVSCVVNGRPVYYVGSEPRPDREPKPRAHGGRRKSGKPRAGRAVSVDGETFPSVRAAARFLETDTAIVRAALNGDTVSGMVKGHVISEPGKEPKTRERKKADQTNHAGGKPKKRVKVNETVFDSVANAAKYFGVSRKTLRHHIAASGEYKGCKVSFV